MLDGIKYKPCAWCTKVQPLENFSRDKTTPTGRNAVCRICKKKYMRMYNSTPERRKRERIRQTSEYYNKTRVKYRKFKIQEDINFKLSIRLRERLNDALKRGNIKKNTKLSKALGCSIPELKSYLESKFQPGMSWDNWGTKGWHIDHIKPLCSFDLSKEEDFLQACNYTNLQPLWAIDNLRKGGKI